MSTNTILWILKYRWDLTTLRVVTRIHSNSYHRFHRTISMETSPFDNCVFNHGKMSFKYQRCFFVVKYEGEGKNLTDQINECSIRHAVLSYPRSQEEMWYIWHFYTSHRNLDTNELLPISDNWYLHVGYLKVRNTTICSRVLTEKRI